MRDSGGRLWAGRRQRAMKGLSRPLDEAALRVLLRELGEAAGRHRFDVAPNPCVGAAVLAGSSVVARGYHEVWGAAHAEINALRAAEASGVAQSDWDTLVVTLEPCSTSGKTPPCVDAIKRAGIKLVVVGALDPDARHRGRGLKLLEEAGIDVVLVPNASPLDDVAPHFVRWNNLERLRRPRPWTIAKWAQTQSGHLTPPQGSGAGRWISSPESLLEVQVLRSRVDAILTGSGTVLADDPLLSVRAPGQTEHPPVRIVLDSVLRTPPDARLFDVDATTADEELGVAGPVHLLCQASADVVRRRALEERGALIHSTRGNDRQSLDLREVQSWLWSQGVRRLLIEAGPTLLTSYFESGFVDQVRVVTGEVRGGEGTSLGPLLAQTRLEQRRDSECGVDAVIDAFVDA